MKFLINRVIVFSPILSYAKKEYIISSQKDRLKQYAGQWDSSVNLDNDSLVMFPEMKMSNFNNNSLTINVFQKIKSNEYEPLLHKIMGYDAETNIIFDSEPRYKKCFF